jgi:hypothetical protein
MQQSAEELDRARADRISAAEAREKARQEAEEAARAESGKYGAFVSGLNRSAGDIDLADRLRRGRRNIERGQEAY